MSDKYWRCFFCDEVFTDPKEAYDHFGDASSCGSDVPGCIDPLRHDEKARIKELREARDYALKMQQDADEIEMDAALYHSMRDEIGRLFGQVGGVEASTPHQAWLKLEAAQNEAAMWKEKYEQANRLLITPLTDSFPSTCDLCGQQIESQSDLDWHGLGNCVEICPSCCGAGTTQQPHASKEASDVR